MFTGSEADGPATRIPREDIMRALHAIDTKSTAAALLAGTVLFAGCGTRALPGARVETATTVPAVVNRAAQPAPMAVSCEPTQRAIVRPVMINGAAVSQVECVSSAPEAAPVAYRPMASAAVPVAYAQTAAPLENAQIVRYPVQTGAAPRAAVYQRAPERIVSRPARTVKKSAIIIGSTAGAGAGVRAIIGGKKGALIGAAVGGGGATLWDQITRRQDRNRGPPRRRALRWRRRSASTERGNPIPR